MYASYSQLKWFDRFGNTLSLLSIFLNASQMKKQYREQASNLIIVHKKTLFGQTTSAQLKNQLA